MTQDYEIIIIGGGPAGLTAGIYASRARRKTVLLEKHGTGGQMALTWEVENYPGVEKISGYDLGQIMERQARSFGLEIRSVEVTGVATDGPLHRVSTTEGELTCRSLVIAAGARSNRLGVPGEAELTGRGVSYCATCDGAFYQGVPVAVVGGGDTALEEAMFLTRYASRVYPRPPQERVPGDETPPGAHRGGAEDRTGARRGRGAHRGQGRRDRPGGEERQERRREPHRRRGRLHLRRHDAEHGVPARFPRRSTPRGSSRRRRTSRRRSPGSSPPATCGPRCCVRSRRPSARARWPPPWPTTTSH